MRKNLAALGMMIAAAAARAVTAWCCRHLGKETYSVLIEITPFYRKEKEDETNA